MLLEVVGLLFCIVSFPLATLCLAVCDHPQRCSAAVYFPSTALDAGNVALCAQSIVRTHSDPHRKNVCAAENNDVCS